MVLAHDVRSERDFSSRRPAPDIMSGVDLSSSGFECLEHLTKACRMPIQLSDVFPIKSSWYYEVTDTGTYSVHPFVAGTLRLRRCGV